MKIDRFNIQKLFPTGVYQNIKVGIEGSLDEGESMEDAMTEAHKKVDDWFNKAYPNVGEVVTYRQAESADPIADQENERLFQQTKSKISKVKTREMAELILNASGFKFNLQLKEIVLNKPSKILNNGKEK